MHISITGDLGSGKSSVAKVLCERLGYKYFSTGLIQRTLGLKNGMNTLEFNKYTDDNKEIDDYIDQHLKDINKSSDLYVLDSRLAWFFIEKSFKVYLLTFNQIAAHRIINDTKRIGEPNAADVNKKIEDSEERRNIENKRFEKNYGAKFDLLHNFDLVIDTSYATLEQVTKTILNAYEKWRQNVHFNKIWFSSQRLYPLENIRVIGRNEAKEVRRNIAENGFNAEFPILVLRYINYFFIYDGHKRFSASIYNSIPLIPLQIIAGNNEEAISGLSAEQYVKDCFQLSILYDWEDAHSFRYFEYPVIEK